MSEQVELLFFDTFAHDNTEEINLDLVQFPKPVYVTEVRIIPLGARVQADFPGGVRLGATNPSQFQIEFFVNDLGKPGASTFETLGGFEYDQNGCINLNCTPDETIRKIPTDGLVLRGWYTTITLAVYGTLTNNITEQIIQPVVNPSLPTQPNTIADAQQIISGSAIESEWPQENLTTVPIEYSTQTPATYHQPYSQAEVYPQEFSDYYGDIPKDPRSYHHTPETDWENKGRPRLSDAERERERSRDMGYQKTGGLERDHSRLECDRRERDREKRFTRSQSRDRDRQTRELREISHDREHERDWGHEKPDYRSELDWDRDRDRERVHERDRVDCDRIYKHEDNYRRSYNREEREERKRPRTPPLQSPKRPHTPQGDLKALSPPDIENMTEEELLSLEKQRRDREDAQKVKSPTKDLGKEARTPPTEENTQMDVEEFEPILSDEDILDDNEHYQDVDYDYTMYTNNDDIIKLFTPGVTDLQKYVTPGIFALKENSFVIDERFKTTIGIADDYFKSSFTKYSHESFNTLNTDIKEEFIHLCEKLISTVGSAERFCDIVKLYYLTKSVNLNDLNSADKDLVSQVVSIVETIVDWLQIALNYDLANIQDQPAYKIRHIKCGVRLADWCCNSVEFIKLLWEKNFNIHKVLLHLYEQEFMALSIKLMILKALDTYLLHKFAIEKFLLGNNDNLPKENGYYDEVPITEANGYKALIRYIQQNPLVRLKFALNSIVKKLNLYEVLHKMHSILIKLRNTSIDISAEEINLVTKCLGQILSFCQVGPFVLSQPKRFLPVSSQFEILRSETKNILVEYFQMFNLLQCFLLLLTNPTTLNLPAIKTPIFESISALLESPEGLEYLSVNLETINVLLKCLLRTDEEMQYNLQDYIDINSHNLGLKIAYKLQALYHVQCLLHIGKSAHYDLDAGEINDQLHALYCLTFSQVGKVAVAEVLGMNDNLRCVLQFLDVLNSREKLESQLSKLKKSPGIAYVVDLIYFVVVTVPNITLLEKYWKVLQQIINLQELFEDSVAFKLNELKPYVIPFENTTVLTYDNISPFLENIEKCIEVGNYFSGTLITSLRIIYHLGISKHSNKSPVLSENPLINYIELKYKHVILQLYSLDGTTTLIKLLQRICDDFEQPSLHTSLFASNHGLQIASIIYPSLKLLNQMLSYVIQCQNTNYKDLTSIPLFLQTYNLLNNFPASSPGYILAQKTKTIIIQTLLVYTQPVSNEIHEKDSLNKTLWTQMSGEVIKYITSAPYTFVSGLLIFSEMLPLPFPIQTDDDLTQDEITWAVNLRKLWSAHLHPHSSVIQEMISKLCMSTQPQLLNLLRRICVQISDLAANSAIMIARGILDSVYEAIMPKEDTAISPCNIHTARLLNFLACLVTHNTIKCAVLHLIHTNSCVTFKTDEKYVSLMQAFAQVLKNNGISTSHIQAQECILSIFQSFCDIEITLLQSSVNGIVDICSDIYLANALPIKEHMLLLINTMIEHLSTENSFVTYLPIMRTLLLLTDNDFGFYHLREHLTKKNDVFYNILDRLSKNFSKSSAECLSLNTLLEFLRVSVTVEEADSSVVYSPRAIKLSCSEIKTLVGWSSSEEKNEKHPLFLIKDILTKAVEEDNTFESLLEGLTAIIKLLTNDQPEDDKPTSYLEVFLPSPETLLVQFSGRTIFSSSDACDERLTSNYWLAVPNEDAENDLENVTCDILDLCRQNLPSDYNIIKEVEKLCKISRSDNPDDKEKNIDDPKLKMKKPFVTPMRARGFARTVQQRPDLFRSRPPNTSRPPSLHVDDFVALETCGAQPTGPTGYNKISREILASTRISRGTRGRAFVVSERSAQYRQMSWWGAGMGRGPYQL